MDVRLPYWGSVIFSIIALVLLVVNISLANANHGLQADIQQRQAALGAGQTFAQVDQGLAQALAEAAKNNDTQAHDLLVSQGLQIQAPPAAAASTATDKSNKK